MDRRASKPKPQRENVYNRYCYSKTGEKTSYNTSNKSGYKVNATKNYGSFRERKWGLACRYFFFIYNAFMSQYCSLLCLHLFLFLSSGERIAHATVIFTGSNNVKQQDCLPPSKAVNIIKQYELMSPKQWTVHGNVTLIPSTNQENSCPVWKLLLKHSLSQVWFLIHIFWSVKKHKKSMLQYLLWFRFQWQLGTCTKKTQAVVL